MTKKDIDKIIDYLCIKGTFSGNFKGYALLYSMTTENISGFINQYSLKNRKVLTVAGSGDQRYNCLLRGASEVVSFDVNPLVDLHLRLKEVAIQELSHSDFLKFFNVKYSDKGDNFLDKSIYYKIRNYLDSDVRLFYDYIINEFRGEPFGRAYYSFPYEYGKMVGLSNYISKDNYQRMPELVSKNGINHMNVNVGSLPYMLDGEKFDMILLSNISDYIHHFYGSDHMEIYKELIDQLVDNLYDGGIIEVGYIYNEYSLKDNVSDFHIDKVRNSIFPKEEYPVLEVSSFYSKNGHDRIVTYQKK